MRLFPSWFSSCPVSFPSILPRRTIRFPPSLSSSLCRPGHCHEKTASTPFFSSPLYSPLSTQSIDSSANFPGSPPTEFPIRYLCPPRRVTLNHLRISLAPNTAFPPAFHGKECRPLFLSLTPDFPIPQSLGRKRCVPPFFKHHQVGALSG